MQKRRVDPVTPGGTIHTTFWVFDSRILASKPDNFGGLLVYRTLREYDKSGLPRPII